MTILKNLNIPHMGSVENAKLLDWIVKEGETFAEGEILYEIETDKTATDVEAPDAGIFVKKLAEPGDEFKVGDLVGLWVAAGTAQADIASALEQWGNASNADSNDTQSPTTGPEPSVLAAAVEERDGPKLSPLVRRLAAEHGVDLATVQGTGEGGRITGDDVLNAANQGTASDEVERVPHSLRRKTIAARMTEAANIPTLTADMEVDLSALFKRREALKAGGAAPTVMALIAHEAVQCLLTHQALNAHWQDDAVLLWKPVHLGVAVNTADGLIVPVVRNADKLDAAALTNAIAEVADRARQGHLKPEDLQGGTFTISNPGALGPTVRAEALLNPPQVALLGLPGIVREPRAIQNGAEWSVEVRPIIRLSLSFDHRALDGGPVIAFLNDLKARIETL